MLRRGYYAILDLKGATAPKPDLVVHWVEQRLAAGPCCLQIRAKALRALDFLMITSRVLPLCRAADVPLCVNDRLDVALASGADIVHIGQEDLPVADVRRLIATTPRRLAIGVSTHNLTQAMAAVQGGADYIGFGPVFTTMTKENPDPVVGIEVLQRVVSEVDVPVVAIGGITLDTVSLVAAAGAHAAAVISAVDRSGDVTQAGRDVAAAFASGFA